MLVMDGLGGLVLLALWIFAFIDVLLTPETACRNLPKLVWIFVVLLIPLIGPIAWLVAGRPWTRAGVPAQRVGAPQARAAGARQERRAPMNPDDDEEFLASLRLRAEEQRRAREQDKPDTSPSDGDSA